MSRRIIIIALVLVLVALLGVGCRRSPWNDGEFRGEGTGYGGPISVIVTITRGKITSIVVTGEQETPGVYDRVIAEIPNRIIEKQSTQVDIVAGATGTSNGVIEAVNNALESARKQ